MIFFALMAGVGLVVFSFVEPQPASDILSSLGSSARAVVGWFDD